MFRANPWLELPQIQSNIMDSFLEPKSAPPANFDFRRCFFKMTELNV
jgi:hypothetical protein